MATATAPTRERVATSETFKFAIARGAFVEALTRAATALPIKGTTLPVLNTVLMRVEGGQIVLTCTDIDRTVSTTIAGVAAMGTGAAALPAKRILEIVTALPSSAVLELSITGTKAKLTAGRSKFEILGMPVEEFPRVDMVASDSECSIAGSALVAALTKVAPHVAPLDHHKSDLPALAGALLHIDEDGTHVIGTDRHRLARLALAVEQSAKPLVGKFVLARAAFGTITKLFGADEKVTVRGTRQQLRFTGAQSTFTTRLLEENYPDYKQFLKLEPTAHAVLTRGEFADALKRVAIVAESRALSLSFAKSELTITTEEMDMGSGEDVINCALESADAQPLLMGLNPRLLLDALEAVGGEQVRLDFCGFAKPVYVRDAATPTSSTLAVVLPLRTIGGSPKEK